MRFGTLKDDNEQGATMVEFAIVMPILLMIIVAILEMGLAFQDRLAISHATRDAARVGAFMGNDADADCAVITSVVGFLSSQLDSVENIQIYKADAAGNQLPAKTNTYTFTSGDPTDCSRWAATVKWDSVDRNVTVGSTSLDIIGIRIQYERPWVTGFPPFSGDFTVDQSSITRMEPEAFA